MRGREQNARQRTWTRPWYNNHPGLALRFLFISRWHPGCPRWFPMLRPASPLTSTDLTLNWGVMNRSVVALTLHLSVALACVACDRSQAAPVPPSPPEVAVTAAVQRDVPVSTEWIGTLDGSINAQIRPQVTGYLLKRLYREGA